jgi:hypothetical protein
VAATLGELIAKAGLGGRAGAASEREEP